MDAKNGEIKWQKGSFDDFDGQKLNWGVCETVVVDGDIVYITPGGKKYNVVALNRFNGEYRLVFRSVGRSISILHTNTCKTSFPKTTGYTYC